MHGLIARWRGRRRHGAGGDAAPSPATQSLQDERETARGLAETIDRAMQMGLWAHADRVAASAARLAKEHPKLSEQLVRLRLARGEADAALAIIDACLTRPASLRLLRAVCLLQLGRRSEAHFDLHEWATRATAPLNARLLLALLEWQAGDADAAIAALLRNLRQLEDPRTLAVLTLIGAARGRQEQAAFWAGRLQSARAFHEDALDFDLMLESLGFNEAVSVEFELSPAHVDALATELLANEEIVPTLVEAQALRPQYATAQLLRAAVERALPDLEDSVAGFEALARLSMILNENEIANSWAQHGLERHAMAAGLARLVQELSPAIPTGDLHKSDVLATIGPNSTSAKTRLGQERAA